METLLLRELIHDAPLKMIGARIQRARKQRGLSLDALAELVGTSRQHLINLEKGRNRPRPAMLSKVAAALDKPAVYFLVEEAGEPNPFPGATAAA